MALPPRHALEQQLLARGQEDEVDLNAWVVIGRYAHHIAVFALQGRAGDDYARRGTGGGGQGGESGLAEEGEPVPAVSVGQGCSIGHFGDVFGGVVLGRTLARC